MNPCEVQPACEHNEGTDPMDAALTSDPAPSHSSALAKSIPHWASYPGKKYAALIVLETLRFWVLFECLV